MNRWKKNVAIILTVAVTTGMTIACGNSSETASTAESSPQAAAADGGQENKGTGDVYELDFYAWSNPENLTPLLESFNADYAGKYNLVYQKLADAATLTINTALASGEKIDVMTQASHTDLRQRADDGVYLGLKQFFDKEGWEYGEKLGTAIEEPQNIDGDYYSVPDCNNINMVFFNKKMFDEAGLEYPQSGWTWEDFRETAIKLTSGSGADKVYGAMLDTAGNNGDNYWDLIARQKLGNNAYYNDDLTASTFGSDEMRESLQFFVDMTFKDQCIVPVDEITALQYYSDPVGMAGLYNGKYAMWVAPVYGCLYLKSSYGEIPEGTDIGMVDMPTPDGAQTITTCYSSTASIPANVENPEAAWELLKYICIDRADLFAGPKAMHPAVEFDNEEDKRAFNEIIFSEKPGLDYDMAMDTMMKDRVLVSKDCTIKQGYVAIQEGLENIMTLVFSGEMGVEEALSKLQQSVDEAITADLAK